MPWFCASMFLYHKTIFCRIYMYFWDFIKRFFIPVFQTRTGLTGWSGRPDRSTGRAQTCTPECTGERSTVPVDRFKESALWKSRSTAPVDRQRVYSLLQLLGRPGRSTGGCNGRILTVGGRPARSTEISWEQSSLKRSTDPVGRSSSAHWRARCARPVDRPGRPATVSSEKSELPEPENLGLKIGLFGLIKKSHKYLEILQK